MKNKVGIYYAFWEHKWEADYAKYAHKAAQLGFDILELPAVSLPGMTPQMIERLLQISADTGLVYTTSLDLPDAYDISSNDDAVREAGIGYVAGLLKKAAQLNVIMFGGVNYAAWNGRMQDSKQAHRSRSIREP
jgi:D-psicose/D-tagatose/L-ribulose 3-epimerase